MAKTVFTNGCFDLIHAGHIDLLRRARALGDRLVVGINSDESVRRIKGVGRPFQLQDERKEILASFAMVDEVIIFDDLTPEQLIQDLKPDVLVKGGDWKVSEIVGAEFVTRNGGEVHSLPLLNGFSSSQIVERIRNNENSSEQRSINSLVRASISEHVGIVKEVLDQQDRVILDCSEILHNTFVAGGKILICGNGGSAADAQHIAAEFVGRFESERQALPAIALTTDTSALTALANDYSFERVFARQVEALAKNGDCLIAISTSGESPNVISAVLKARELGCKVIGLTGSKGKKLAGLCDECHMVPSERTARIQEAHILIAHIWCELIDGKLASEVKP